MRWIRIAMRWVKIAFLTLIGVLVAVILFLFSFGAVLQYQRISKLCTGKTKVETPYDAINAVRNYDDRYHRDTFAELRKILLFQEGGLGEGWSVRKETKLFVIDEFEVEFVLRNPEFVIECDVLACGAVNRCKTLGHLKF